jgi:quercetin dioxygenase-like cupin family protein
MQRISAVGPLLAAVTIVGCTILMPSGQTPLIVAPGSGRAIDSPGRRQQPGNSMKVLVERQATKGGVAFFEATIAPRSFGAPPHVHHGEDEYFYVLEGEVRILNDGQTLAAPKGTFAAMTRGHLHAFWNASDMPARMLVGISPGDFGSFFDEVALELQRNGAKDPATVRATVARVAATHKVDMYPDRIPEEARPFLPH